MTELSSVSKEEKAYIQWQKDVGLVVEEGGTLPKLNTLLLEQVVNWATRAKLNLLETGEPGHDQASWAGRLISKYRKNLPRRKTLPVTLQQLDGELNYCGTSFCIAGYAAQLTGNLNWDVEPYFDDQVVEVSPEPACNELLTHNHGVLNLAKEAKKNGFGDYFRADGWMTAGALILGITEEEADDLFGGSNTIQMVREIACEIAAKRGEILHLIPLEK